MRLSLAAPLLAAAAAAALLVGAPAARAFDEAEKAALHEEIRAFLKTNPEVVIEALQAYDAKQRAEAAALETKLLVDNAEAIYYDDHSHVRGNPEGDLTLVEFLDYRCGFCKRAHSKILDIVEKDGNIRYVIKEFPILGPQSVVAAKAALASIGLDEAKTSAFQDLLMEHEGELDTASILALGKQAGLDEKKTDRRHGRSAHRESHHDELPPRALAGHQRHARLRHRRDAAARRSARRRHSSRHRSSPRGQRAGRQNPVRGPARAGRRRKPPPDAPFP